MSTKPSAINEYMSPIDAPLMSSANANSSSSPIAGSRSRSFQGASGRCRAMDGDGGIERAPAAIFERDLHAQLNLLGVAVECFDDLGILLGDEVAANLAGARHLGVVGFELLVDKQDPAHAYRVRKRQVDLCDLVEDETGDLGLAAEIHEAGVGKAAPLCPIADRAQVDGDHRRNERAAVAEGDRLADERAEFQLVLDELRRKRRAVRKLSDIP